MSDHNSPLTEAERTQYRSVIGQLSRVAGIARPDINFSVCKASSNRVRINISELHCEKLKKKLLVLGPLWPGLRNRIS